MRTVNTLSLISEKYAKKTGTALSRSFSRPAVPIRSASICSTSVFRLSETISIIRIWNTSAGRRFTLTGFHFPIQLPEKRWSSLLHSPPTCSQCWKADGSAVRPSCISSATCQHPICMLPPDADISPSARCRLMLATARQQSASQPSPTLITRSASYPPELLIQGTG